MNKPTSVDLTLGKQLAISCKPYFIDNSWRFRLIIPGQLQFGYMTIFETDLSLATSYMIDAMEDKGYFVIFSSRSN